MTICSNSVDLEAPRVGDVWIHVSLDMFYLVLNARPALGGFVVWAVGLNTDSTAPVLLSATGMMHNQLWKRFSTMEAVHITLDPQ